MIDKLETVDWNEIKKLADEGRCNEAIAGLDRAIERDAGDASLWYGRGRIYWRLGQKSKAISDYEEAVSLDPESPARLALQLAREVMDFYNPDLLNP